MCIEREGGGGIETTGRDDADGDCVDPSELRCWDPLALDHNSMQGPLAKSQGYDYTPFECIEDLFQWNVPCNPSDRLSVSSRW